MHPKSLPDIRHGLTSAQECARLDNPDESTIMPAGKTATIKSLLRGECLPALAKASPYFSLDDVRAWLREHAVTCPAPLLREYLSQSMQTGLIYGAGRGWYSRLASACPLNSKPVARLVREVERTFPLLDFTCWSTEQVRSFGHLLLVRFVSFVHTDRDSMSSVYEFLKERGYDAHLNPRGTAAREFTVRERTVVVRPRPTTQPHEGRLVTVEGILVEFFIERRVLNLTDEGEYFRLFANLASSCRISLATFLDYARERRPAGIRFAKHIKAELLKTPR
jgi:hypothetical protein